MNTVRKADYNDRKQCVRILASAFDHDPVINWFIRQDSKREMALNLFFNIAFSSLTLPFEQVYTSGCGNGVALWTPPGKWKLGIFEQLRLLPFYSRIFNIRRLHRVIPPIQKMQNLHPEFPHYYLFALGVAPQMQNRGLGSFLLKEILMKCDSEQLPAYLEATTPANRDLYRRHGFRIVRKFTLSDEGPEMWFMLRDPARVS